MATRTVTGNIKHADGTSWASGNVVFVLEIAFETSTAVYPTEAHTEITDVNGAFSVTLGVPDTGTARYRVILPSNESHEFNLEAGNSIDLVMLITLAGISVDPSDLQTLLDAVLTIHIITVTDTYFIMSTDQYVRCNGTFTATLPPATGGSALFAVKNIGIGTITLACDGAETIDGAPTVTLTTLAAIVLIDAGVGNWDTIAI